MASEGHKKGEIVLYSYWRSSSAWRVRNVLSIKGIKYEYKAVNLLEGNQKKDEYAKNNPMKHVPTLIVDGQSIGESVAIMEYLEETNPNPPLLPKDPIQRAKTRQIVEVIVGDIQPLQNLRTMQKVSSYVPAEKVDETKSQWANYWITFGFEGIEKILSQTAGKYCVGDSITLADCVLVPQVYNAHRYKVDMAKFPIISRINSDLLQLESFKAAIPEVMPDAPNQ